MGFSSGQGIFRTLVVFTPVSIRISNHFLGLPKTAGRNVRKSGNLFCNLVWRTGNFSALRTLTLPLLETGAVDCVFYLLLKCLDLKALTIRMSTGGRLVTGWVHVKVDKSFLITIGELKVW